MGQWNMTIRGVGAHHNADFPKDADRMLTRFARELREAGHSIVSATITYGGEQDVIAAPSREPADPT